VAEQDGPFARVGVVGLGLIGGSIALAARLAWPHLKVTGFDRHARTAARARRHAVHDVVGQLADLDGTDLLILAVPLESIAGLMPAVAGFRHQPIVTDVGSTKRDVMAAAAASGLASFVGGHPMAGRERGGLDNARADLFSGRPWLLVARDPGAHDARLVERFVAGLGATPQWTDAETHDRTMAYVSHLPQLISVALMNAAAGALDARGLSAAGRAFEEMTRLASSPSDLWHGILSRNTDFVAEALSRFVASLPAAGALTDSRWTTEAFDRAAAARGATDEGRHRRR
jgi:prephenate dehydrogenase